MCVYWFRGFGKIVDLNISAVSQKYFDDVAYYDMFFMVSGEIEVKCSIKFA